MDSLQNWKAGNVKDLPAGDMKIIRAGNREILIINTGTGIYAMDNSCIHGGCRLAYGRLEGEHLRCLCHGSVFDVKTGEVLEGPATARQPTHAVIVRDDEIILAP